MCEKLPRNICVAVSGGCDSMAALDFLRRSHNVTVLHYNHGTSFAPLGEEVVRKYCESHNLKMVTGYLKESVPPGRSAEDFWREQRYEFFEKNSDGMFIVTCHHLNDVAETWVFGSLHGNPKLIPHKRGNYVRPFLMTEKQVFYNWCERKQVPYVEDPSNSDTSYMRNYIRHEIMPKALAVNPGLHKVLKKKLKNEIDILKKLGKHNDESKSKQAA
jgi:tRNA(Ile)-lysidine synthase